ncbi:MAG: CRISPR-associated protein Cas5 [Acutalibacteraceae bacterium]
MKAIRIHIKQSSANYRREETVKCRMTYPLPPPSTVIGALHKACGYTEYHPMDIGIQGQYGSLRQKLFKEDCFLNRTEDDRSWLVKMKNPDMLSSAYEVVAISQKGQGNSFEKGITINVVNPTLLEEYRYLRRVVPKHIERYKQKIKVCKDNLKKAKADLSKTELKKQSDRIKKLESHLKDFEERRYTKPYSRFRTLTKGIGRYEILCDVELIIHVVSDESTMNDIMENIHNLTAIGRSEDFVEVLDVSMVDLKEVESKFKHKKYTAYIPCTLIEKNNEALRLRGNHEGIMVNGTKYLLPKNYTLEGKSGSQKRIFTKVPVLYTSDFRIKGKTEGVYIDENGEDTYAVFLM